MLNVSWEWFTNRITDLITPVSEVRALVDMDIKVVPDWNVSVYIEWSPITPPDEGVDDSDVSYMVYSSKSEFGPFNQLTSAPIRDLSYFTDYQVQDSKIYEQYITVEILYGDGRRYRSYPVTPSVILKTWHRLRQKDIIRREHILLDKFVGAESIIFTRKWSGLRCKSCWDTTHLKVTDDHCEECYGTGYQGGYDTGMRTKLQYTSIDAVSNFTYYGADEPINISAWGLPFPLLHPDAIVLRTADSKAFIIEGHRGSTEMLTTMQRQTVVMKELGRDSIEYKLFNRSDVVDAMPRKPHIHT